MKRLFRSKKSIAALATLVVVGVSAIGAYAYFTSTGSGTGAASVGTSTKLAIIQTTAISGLAPNGPTVPVVYKITNPVVNGAQNLGAVTFTITGFAGNSNLPNACGSSDFIITPGSTAVGTIGAGATYTSIAGTEPTIQMTDTGANQDGCQNATLTLALTAAQGA